MRRSIFRGQRKRQNHADRFIDFGDDRISVTVVAFVLRILPGTHVNWGQIGVKLGFFLPFNPGNSIG